MTIARESFRKADFRGVATGKRLAPVHPGEVLLKEFIEPMGLTRYKVAKAIKVQQRRIDEICSGERAITAATALRLAKLFGMEAQTWMNLQAQYDLEIAERELSKQIDKEVTPLPQAA
jgi:addiction module HigA family antidote